MVVQPPQQQQQQQQQQAAALLAAGTPGAAASRGMNPFWNAAQAAQAGGPPPQLMGGFAGNLYSQMAAYATAQENATAMIAVAKLSKAKGAKSEPSKLVVRNSVRKFNVNGGILSVAQWTRKTVEENLEWLVNLSKRHAADAKCILLAYGDGCETLVLLDDHIDKVPQDFKKIQKVGIGLSTAPIDSSLDEAQLASQGVLHATDSLWEHIRYESITNTDNKVQKCLFIHICVAVWSDSIEGRRRVLQVRTGKKLSFKPNPLFEQQVLGKWKEHGGTGLPVLSPSDPSVKETLITFNPKELLLLEKAFDNRLTSRDLKTKVEKYTKDDKINCQLVIKRANDEFVMRGPSRKRRKKSEIEAAKAEKAKAEKAKAEAKKPAAKAAPKTPTKKESPKKTKKSAKKETKKPKEDEDEDDQPISKMVGKKAPPKRSPKKTARQPEPKKSKTPSRGRKSETTKSKEDKKRSRSKSKGRK